MWTKTEKDVFHLHCKAHTVYTHQYMELHVCVCNFFYFQKLVRQDTQIHIEFRIFRLYKISSYVPTDVVQTVIIINHWQLPEARGIKIKSPAEHCTKMNTDIMVRRLAFIFKFQKPTTELAVRAHHVLIVYQNRSGLYITQISYIV